MPIERLYIDAQVSQRKETRDIIAYTRLPARTIESLDAIYKDLLTEKDPVGKGKSTLIITRNRGRFIKHCPGTRYYNCCGYEILHIGTFCDMDCAYCILQSYFHPPFLQYFINHDDLEKELDLAFQSENIRRFGTGEFTDSLIWEQWTNLSSLLVPKFARQSTAILELKTKTTHIRHLSQYNHNRKTIVSWSLNTEKMINSEERNTASLKERLSAARTCEKWGYPLSFHFDPLLIYPGCETEYRNVIKQLFSTVDPENIVWISLGSFRFMPDLKPVIQQRFPDSKIVYGEFISGLDNKMRYFKPLRLSLYQKIIGWIKEAAPDAVIYFCMEDDEIWKKSLGFVPKERGGLAKMLDESAQKHCHLKSDCKK